ncbi:MAG TPA: hypothetical protein VNT79_07985 [Phycisphaerae bacterium]|nr:hypothetical protein [Phycisphaerae bacterium]
MTPRALKILAVAVMAAALCVVYGWNRESSAQNYLAQAKGKGAAAQGWYGEFADLLGAHGDKAMMLEAHVHSSKEGELIGKVVASNDAFLILKAQDQRNLYFVTWDDVTWVTARPN